MNKYINPNILNEGNQMLVLQDNDDEMEVIVRCNNCGQPTKYGETRMCSGFVGCDNKIIVDGKEVECYFDDLMPRIMYAKEYDYETYRKRKFYRYRDGYEGGLAPTEQETIKKCFNCNQKIEDTYFKCLDNFMQTQYFEYEDERDNVFCSKECFCEFLTLEEVDCEDKVEE